MVHLSCKNYIVLTILVFIQAFALSSCEKILEVKPPSTQLSRGNVFASDASATAAMLGIYGSLSLNGFASGDATSITYLTGLSSDELVSYSTDANLGEFYKNNITATNLNVSALWSGPFSTIYNCNSIIEGVADNAAISSKVKNQIIGEALFTRTFSYFYLLNLFGDVPLILTTDYKNNTNAVRTSKDSIYSQLISDLLKAKDLMVSDYSFSNGDKSRPNKYVAEFLLARIYLYTQQFQQAEETASDIIAQTDKYHLEDSLSQVFYKNSTEAVWQLAPVINAYTNEAGQFILYAVPTTVALSKTLVDNFVPGDLRMEKWTGSFPGNDTSYRYAYKYKNTFSHSVGIEYSMVFRLAELYLIRAEARLMQQKISGADGAASDINAIRVRAGLQVLAAGLSSNDMLKEIQQQRQLEFFCEWGNRWFDLKRYKSSSGSGNSLADETLPITKGIQWKSTASLYPIPQNQIDNDPNMADQQNPGY